MKEKIALSIILIFTIVEANSQNFDNKIHERRKAFINQFIANYKTALIDTSQSVDNFCKKSTNCVESTPIFFTI